MPLCFVTRVVHFSDYLFIYLFIDVLLFHFSSREQSTFFLDSIWCYDYTLNLSLNLVYRFIDSAVYIIYIKLKFKRGVMEGYGNKYIAYLDAYIDVASKKLFETRMKRNEQTKT